MSEPLLRALVRVRGVILDDDALVRAVASGRQRGSQPPWRRVELRYVDLKAGRHLQVTAYDDAQAHTRNHPVGDQARAALDDLLDVHDTHFQGTAPSGRFEDFHGVHLVFRGTVRDGVEPRVVETDGTTDDAAWVPVADIESGAVRTLDVVRAALHSDS